MIKKKYEDIINISYPLPTKRKKMSLNDRAAQFSPFAALTGYSEDVAEKGRYVEERPNLCEDDIFLLNLRLNILEEKVKERPKIIITRFVKDKRKNGGSLYTNDYIIRKVDKAERLLTTDKNEHILIDDIIFIDGEIFKKADIR